MGMSFYTILTTLIIGSLFLTIFAKLAPYMKRNWSLPFMLGIAFLFLFRLVFPVEFPFTLVIRDSNFLPVVQRVLDREIYKKLTVGWIFLPSLLVIWSAGFLLSLVRSMHDWKRRRENWAHIPQVAQEQSCRVMKQLMSERGWTFQYKLYQSNQFSVPAIYGITHPKIVLPSLELEESQLRYILEHECTHHLLKDNAIYFWVQSFHHIFWMNPKKDMIDSCFDALIEYRCDERVLQGKGEKERGVYLQTLKSIYDQNEPLMDARERAAFIGKMNRVENPPKSRPVHKAMFVIASILLIVLSYSVVFQPYIEPPEFPAVINEGKDIDFGFDDPNAYALDNGDGFITIYFSDKEFVVSEEYYEGYFSYIPLKEKSKNYEEEE